MPQRSRKLKQTSKRTVFFVAMEGSVTERKYFDALIKAYNLRNVRLLKKSRTRSSPLDVVKRLEKQLGNRTNDHSDALDERYWAVFDTDRRPIETLQSVSKRAAKKNICIAASNPCFEIWLMLHQGAVADFSGLEGSAATGGCDKVVEFLKRHVDRNYDKSNYDASKYIEHIANAIKNANASDSKNTEAWMKNVSSRVYKLVQSIIDSSPNNPLN